jgi:hypothetical protein
MRQAYYKNLTFRKSLMIKFIYRLNANLQAKRARECLEQSITSSDLCGERDLLVKKEWVDASDGSPILLNREGGDGQGSSNARHSFDSSHQAATQPHRRRYETNYSRVNGIFFEAGKVIVAPIYG